MPGRVCRVGEKIIDKQQNLCFHNRWVVLPVLQKGEAMCKIEYVFRKRAFQDFGYASGVSGEVTFVLTTQNPISTYADALRALDDREDELVGFLKKRNIEIPHHPAFAEGTDDEWEWIVNRTNPFVTLRPKTILTDITRGVIVDGVEVDCLRQVPIEVPYFNPRALVAVHCKDGFNRIIAWEREVDLFRAKVVRTDEEAVNQLIETREYFDLQSHGDQIEIRVFSGKFQINVRFDLRFVWRYF